MPSQLDNLQLTSSMTGQGFDDYKALVCVFMYGGWDSYNVLAPYEETEYADYASHRKNLAVPHDELLQIGHGGRQFGVSPHMPELAELYNTGRAAFIANVGSLSFPTTKENYRSVLPQGLFSHNDCQEHWQTSKPDNRNEITGWGGRMADLLRASNTGSISPCLSIYNSNLMQVGNQVSPYVVDARGVEELKDYGPVYQEMFDTFYQVNSGDIYPNLMESTLAQRKRLGVDSAAVMNSILTMPLDTDPFDSSFGSNLRVVAKLIRDRETLGHKRQIFFVPIGGWDMHDRLTIGLRQKLPEVSKGIADFTTTMEAMGLGNQVTLFTASEFGRTLSSNGDGSDHAWAGNQIIAGGAVQSGIYGTYPESLAEGNPFDINRGRLIPTTSVDQYNAELALWFGMTNSQLEDILPNIRRFYSSSATSSPLQLLKEQVSL